MQPCIEKSSNRGQACTELVERDAHGTFLTQTGRFCFVMLNNIKHLATERVFTIAV
ncbi:MAG: hypothetical protein JW787_07305 [Sedimentisphaerales bacterium]|nr:hypothetical protein [Sedimentisphaerales bacterium]